MKWFRNASSSLIVLISVVASSVGPSGLFQPYAARAQGDPCTGDCDSDGAVTVSELVAGVSSALGRGEAPSCTALDASGDGRVQIDELVQAVLNSFNECGALGTKDIALTRFASGDLSAAREFFAAASSADPNDDLSELLAAVLGPVDAVLTSPSLRVVAERSGITLAGDGRDVCSFGLQVPDEVPNDAPTTGAIIEAARTVLIPALEESLQRIERIDAAAVIEFDPADLPECIDFNFDSPFEIDHGDRLAFATGIRAALAGLDLASAYDVDVGLKQAIEVKMRDVLALNLDLLTLTSRERLTSARTLLASAFDDAAAAIDSIRAEKDEHDDDFIVILPEDAEEADKVRRMIERGRQSLFGEARIPIDIVTGKVFLTDDEPSPHERLNLDPFFSGAFAEVRQFLPAFDAMGNFDTRSFPDPTFAGSAPDLTQQDIDDFLQGANFNAIDDFVDSSDFFDKGIIVVVP